jgi:small GTP-binding protein
MTHVAMRSFAQPLRRSLCMGARSAPPLPIVAIVGAPNAGKSTLFNRLSDPGPGLNAFRPRALVSPMAGTTRDRLETIATWNGSSFRVVDTGGVYHLDAALTAAAAADRDRVEMEWLVQSQVLTAVRGASIVLFVVDAQAGLTPTDERLAPTLRRLVNSGEAAPTVLLTVNKVDHPHVAERCGFFADFYTLGLGEPLPLSAYHGRGVAELLDRIVELLPPPAATADLRAPYRRMDRRMDKAGGEAALGTALGTAAAALDDDAALDGEGALGEGTDAAAIQAAVDLADDLAEEEYYYYDEADEDSARLHVHDLHLLDVHRPFRVEGEGNARGHRRHWLGHRSRHGDPHRHVRAAAPGRRRDPPGARERT